jgi:hypothetical protein
VHGRKRKKKEKEKEEEKGKEKKGKALYAEAAALLARTENTRDSRAREDQTQTEKRWRQYAETELAAQFGLTKVSGGTCDTKLSKRQMFGINAHIAEAINNEGGEFTGDGC